MARRVLYKDNSLLGSGNPLSGYKFVGYNGVTYSQLDSLGNISPIGGGSGGNTFTSISTGTITITDGAQNGYVLTSDGSGNASWSPGGSGTSGTSGTSGAAGASGTSGTSGAAGASGTSGTSGAAGASGTSGTSGAAGASGTSGTSGAAGASGTSGTSGLSGGGLTGSGTVDYLPKWTGSNSLSSTSSVYNSGETVGIGTNLSSGNELLSKLVIKGDKNGILLSINSNDTGLSNTNTGIYNVVRGTEANGYGIVTLNQGQNTDKIGTYTEVTGSNSPTRNVGSFVLVSGGTSSASQTIDLGLENPVIQEGNHGSIILMTGTFSNTTFGSRVIIQATSSLNYGSTIRVNNGDLNVGLSVGIGNLLAATEDVGILNYISSSHNSQSGNLLTEQIVNQGFVNGDKYGSQITISGNGSSDNNYGILADVRGANNTQYGLYSWVRGTSSNNYGIYIRTENASSNIALYAESGTSVFNEGVVIGSPALNSKAILELVSSTKGFLPPRQTQSERTAIVSPPVGLVVYQTDATEGLYVYKSGGWTFIV